MKKPETSFETWLNTKNESNTTGKTIVKQVCLEVIKVLRTDEKVDTQTFFSLVRTRIKSLCPEAFHDEVDVFPKIKKVNPRGSMLKFLSFFEIPQNEVVSHIDIRTLKK